LFVNGARVVNHNGTADGSSGSWSTAPYNVSFNSGSNEVVLILHDAGGQAGLNVNILGPDFPTTLSLTSPVLNAALDNAFSATATGPIVPPVVLDLNRDGEISYSQITADINGDGLDDISNWVGPEDGLLFWDKNRDGSLTEMHQFAFAQFGGERYGRAHQSDGRWGGVD